MRAESSRFASVETLGDDKEKKKIKDKKKTKKRKREKETSERYRTVH